MTKEIDVALDDDRPYIAMSDRLVLYPHNGTSTAVWDMEDDRCLGLLEGHPSAIKWASINKNTAVITADVVNGVGPVKIWSLETMQCTANLTTTSRTAVGLLKDRLLLGSRDGPIKVWDFGGSTPVALMDLQGHTGEINSIDASDSKNVALSGSDDYSVRLWDLRTGQCVRLMEGHGDTVNTFSNAVNTVSMDSACKTAVSGSEDMTVKLWDIGSGQCIKTYQHGQCVDSVMMHESGISVLACGYECRLQSWALGCDQPLLDADLSPLYDTNSYMSFAASRDLSKVAVSYRKASGGGALVSVWKK